MAILIYSAWQGFTHCSSFVLFYFQRYLDPRNPDQAKSDTKGLMDIIDNDKDGYLSWDEIMQHKDVFIQSKVVNVKRTLHDEF